MLRRWSLDGRRWRLLLRWHFVRYYVAFGIQNIEELLDGVLHQLVSLILLFFVGVKMRWQQILSAIAIIGTWNRDCALVF